MYTMNAELTSRMAELAAAVLADKVDVVEWNYQVNEAHTAASKAGAFQLVSMPSNQAATMLIFRTMKGQMRDAAWLEAVRADAAALIA